MRNARAFPDSKAKSKHNFPVSKLYLKTWTSSETIWTEFRCSVEQQQARLGLAFVFSKLYSRVDEYLLLHLRIARDRCRRAANAGWTNSNFCCDHQRNQSQHLTGFILSLPRSIYRISRSFHLRPSLLFLVVREELRVSSASESTVALGLAVNSRKEPKPFSSYSEQRPKLPHQRRSTRACTKSARGLERRAESDDSARPR